ncbi:siderophore ferric iron reductase [Shewanella surugensis]|uniref:Siderophore ferric iron reductase n=1 Tax=Shewanella surugensis TaxID=212020 RepID=A0ABT0LCI1_9GAMM|nr:siderophore ferric iron reductase [Shewanella surugensis]MCL1125411.1 siderophore ferric iron reductase [Shewanella surugensis]
MSTIDALTRLSPQLHAALCYQAPVEKDVLLSADADAFLLRALYEYHREQYPQAGKVYAATRTWSLMYWQPVFLSVLCVHGLKMAPMLGNLVQHAQNGSIYGYFFSCDEVGVGHQDELIQTAAARLKTLYEGYYQTLSSIAKVPRRNAYRLIADSVLSALSRLTAILPITNQQVLAWSESWLTALGLSSQSQLMLIDINAKQQILGLDRIACCMHYLRDPDDLCRTCSKQCKAIRMERIKSHYIRELS